MSNPELRRTYIGRKKRGADGTKPQYGVRTVSGKPSHKTEARLCSVCGEMFFAGPYTKVARCDGCR